MLQGDYWLYNWDMLNCWTFLVHLDWSHFSIANVCYFTFLVVFMTVNSIFHLHELWRAVICTKVKHSHWITRSSADDEIVQHASRWTRMRQVSNTISGICGSQDTMIRVGFGMHVTSSVSYPLVCWFPLTVAQCDHNLLITVQTDR